MSEFSRQLRKEFEAPSPWGDVNPLVIIGLTEAILDLGLTEDQIYATIRSYARQLSAQVHPDRNPANISPERQRQIIGAFDFLDDRQNFIAALADFRNLRAEDRREIKALSQSISVLRQRLESYETKTNVITEERTKLAQERNKFKREKLTEPLAVPPLAREITRLREDVKNQQSLLRQANQSTSEWKFRCSNAVAYMANLGSVGADVPTGILAFNAHWVAIASLWFPRNNIPNPSPLDQRGVARKDFRLAIAPLGIGEEGSTELLKAWTDATQKFSLKPGSSGYPLGLSIIKLDGGVPRLVFGHPSGIESGRIVGSISSEKLPAERDHLIVTLPPDRVFSYFTPFLAPGRLLVSVLTEKHRTFSWSTCRAFRFNTKRFILGVG